MLSLLIIMDFEFLDENATYHKDVPGAVEHWSK